MNYKEVFQLAQEKGYNWVKELPDYPSEIIWEKEIYQQICLIQKWLRDEYKIYVDAHKNTINGEKQNSFKNFDYDVHIGNYRKFFSTGEFDNYEQALMEGINEALKLLP